MTVLRLGKHGWFGNQMFQFAASIGIAKKRGAKYIFWWWFYNWYFENPVLTKIEWWRQNYGLVLSCRTIQKTFMLMGGFGCKTELGILWLVSWRFWVNQSRLYLLPISSLGKFRKYIINKN
ncbi:MAG: hypothetical protein ACQ9MH_09545 [Nitrospinales bacterium]